MTKSSANIQTQNIPATPRIHLQKRGPRTVDFPIASDWLVAVPPLPSANFYDNVKLTGFTNRGLHPIIHAHAGRTRMFQPDQAIGGAIKSIGIIQCSVPPSAGSLMLLLDGRRQLTEIIMTLGWRALLVLLAFGMLLHEGCATLQGREPIHVIIAGVEPLQGEELELRMQVKLRIQNPNDLPLDFNGVSVQMAVQGKRFATGVSDVGGKVPRFGETIVDVPVTISVFGIVRQTFDVMTNPYREKLAYEMTGKLAGPAFNSIHFTSKGEFTLPAEIFESLK
jgi:LEA14-like dessication related protein